MNRTLITKEAKGPISLEKYWFYCLKNVLGSILGCVFWIFPPSDTAVQLESAESKHNTILKSLFQDSFRHIFWAMRKIHHTFLKKKRPLISWLFFFSGGVEKLGPSTKAQLTRIGDNMAPCLKTQINWTGDLAILGFAFIADKILEVVYWWKN